MQKFFRLIKRKRNLRRMSVAWLFLLALELFCPVFCDEPAFAAEHKSPQAEINMLVEGEKDSPDVSVSAAAFESTDDGEAFCDDECLCHAVAIPSLNGINVKEFYSRSEAIRISYGKPLFNSLPPPYQPPKNS